MNLDVLLNDVLKVTEDAASFIRSQAGKVKSADIEIKSRNSLVSYVDKSAEQILVSGLRALIPGAGFITEEETVSQSTAAYTWVLDPLDGTTNFLQQIPLYAVSVGLLHHGELVIGVVSDIESGEVYSARKGGGAWCNGHPIRVSSRTTIDDAVVATGFPYAAGDVLPPLVSVFEYFLKNAGGIRRLGSAAIDLAYVACGRFDAYYETTLHAWDMAGGILIVREAGGIVTDFAGKDDMMQNGSIIAGPPTIQEAVSAQIQILYPS